MHGTPTQTSYLLTLLPSVLGHSVLTYLRLSTVHILMVGNKFVYLHLSSAAVSNDLYGVKLAFVFRKTTFKYWYDNEERLIR